MVVTGGTVVVVVVVGGGDESRRNGPVMRSCSTPRRTRSLTCPTGKRLRCTVLRKSLSVCGVQPVGFQAWLSVDEIMHAVATAVVVIDLDADADLPKVLAIGADQSGRWLEVIWLRFSDRDVAAPVRRPALQRPGSPADRWPGSPFVLQFRWAVPSEMSRERGVRSASGDVLRSIEHDCGDEAVAVVDQHDPIPPQIGSDRGGRTAGVADRDRPAALLQHHDGLRCRQPHDER